MDEMESQSHWKKLAEQSPIAEAATVDDEERHIHAWRMQQLQQLGLSWLLAQVSAPLVDWHDVAALVERGCSPELAVEILR